MLLWGERGKGKKTIQKAKIFMDFNDQQYSMLM